MSANDVKQNICNPEEINRLLYYIDKYQKGTLGHNYDTEEDLLNLCQSFVINDKKYIEEYLKILQFITYDSYKFGFEPYFMENNTLLGNFYSLYSKLDLEERRSFSRRVIEISYNPLFDFRSIDCLEQCFRLAIDSNDSDLISWLIPDWSFLLFSEEWPMSFVGAIMICDLMCTDIIIIEEYCKNMFDSFWNVFTLNLSAKQFKYFTHYIDIAIDRNPFEIKLSQNTISIVIDKLETVNQKRAIEYLSKRL